MFKNYENLYIINKGDDMKVYSSLIDLIGNTPLIELKNIEKKYKLKSKLFAKVEMFNPTGSIKARITKNMIYNALEKKIINKDTVIIEPTSGNTGIALAAICASLKMRFIAVMPESMSIERRKLISCYGGEIVLTPSKDGMNGSVEKSLELAKEYKNSFIPSQFDNLDNPSAHYFSTGKEIYDDLDGNVDIIVACIGTGGTLTGISKYLKEKKDIISIGIEPLSSPLINKGFANKHKIQGIGANFIPKTLDLSYIDRVDMISDEDSIKYARELAKEEGLFVGFSSGAAYKCALDEAIKNENKNIVVIFPDTGERYLSTELIDYDDAM